MDEDECHFESMLYRLSVRGFTRCHHLKTTPMWVFKESVNPCIQSISSCRTSSHPQRRESFVMAMYLFVLVNPQINLALPPNKDEKRPRDTASDRHCSGTKNSR
jgi:hypothetical protein